jgi:nucleoside-diphosphate-sugar epimerase
MSRCALITGGVGFIGSFIARKLIEDNVVDKIVALDHYGRYTSSLHEDFIDYRKLRIKDIEDKVIIERGEAKYSSILLNLLDKYRPLYIFHLAALPLAKVENLNTNEAMDGSVISTANIFEVVGFLKKKYRYQPERIIYASSSMVYGDFEYEPADENHPLSPKEIYGTMKLAGEQIVRGLSNYYALKSTVIRPSAVYGPTDMNRRVSQIFIEKAINGEIIQIQGANETLDFTYVKDIAKGFVLVATHPKAIGETFNITRGEASRLLDYVLELKKHFPDLQYEIVSRDDFRPKRGTLSIKKAKELLNYTPDYDLEKGIGEYIAFLRKYHPKLTEISL